MSDDLIERLKDFAQDGKSEECRLMREAAAELSRLRELTGAEPRFGRLYSIQFSENDTTAEEGEDEPLPPGTYITIKMDTDEPWHAGTLAVIQMSHPPPSHRARYHSPCQSSGGGDATTTDVQHQVVCEPRSA